MDAGLRSQTREAEEEIMTAEKKTEITRLALEAHKASERLRVLGMQNTALSPEEKEKQAVEYALARAEMFEADRLLTKEISASGF